MIGRELKNPRGEHTALIGEKQQVVVRIGDLEVRRDIVFLGHSLTAYALTAPVLLLVCVEFYPLHIAVATQGDYDLFMGFGVFPSPVAQFFRVDFGTALIAVLSLEFMGFLADNCIYFRVICKKFFKILY